MKKISVITPTYNEQDNVKLVVDAIKQVAKKEQNYIFEHILIDNASTDQTVNCIKEIIKDNPHVGLVINNRNFGQARSPFHALTLVESDATIGLCADLQEPPELIHDFLRKWEEGALVVGGVKESSEENRITFLLRNFYYKLLSIISEHDLVSNFTGFALYDKSVIEEFRKINDLSPYFRGLISDLGFKIETVEYKQRERRFGVTKNNFFTLFDFALSGMISHSKIPIRIATLIGFVFSIFTFICGTTYLILKLLFWDYFEFGLAPLIILISFGLSIIIFFLGIIGEYIGAIHSEILIRPRVLEKQRINYPVKNLLNNN